MEFTFALSGDAVATLTVSKQIDPDDVDTLWDYLDAAKKALQKAAKARPATPAPGEAAPNGA